MTPRTLAIIALVVSCGHAAVEICQRQRKARQAERGRAAVDAIREAERRQEGDGAFLKALQNLCDRASAVQDRLDAQKSSETWP